MRVQWRTELYKARSKESKYKEELPDAAIMYSSLDLDTCELVVACLSDVKLTCEIKAHSLHHRFAPTLTQTTPPFSLFLGVPKHFQACSEMLKHFEILVLALLFMDNRCPEAVHPRGPAEGARSHD